MVVDFDAEFSLELPRGGLELVPLPRDDDEIVSVSRELLRKLVPMPRDPPVIIAVLRCVPFGLSCCSGLVFGLT